MRKKQLRKGPHKLVCGVCAGLAEYFSWPVWVMRLVWVVALVLTKSLPVIIVYAALAGALPDHLGRGGLIGKRRGMICLAAVLIAAGIYILLRVLLPQINHALLFGVLLIALGICLLCRGLRKNK